MDEQQCQQLQQQHELAISAMMDRILLVKPHMGEDFMRGGCVLLLPFLSRLLILAQDIEARGALLSILLSGRIRAGVARYICRSLMHGVVPWCVRLVCMPCICALKWVGSKLRHSYSYSTLRACKSPQEIKGASTF